MFHGYKSHKTEAEQEIKRSSFFYVQKLSVRPLVRFLVLMRTHVKGTDPQKEILRSCVFMCSLHHAKKLFYRWANAIFGEIGRIAPEEVVLQHQQTYSCYSIWFGSVLITKSDLLFMDFAFNGFFIKSFETSNINHVKYCKECFSFDTPGDLWWKRVTKFQSISKFTDFYVKV